MWAMWLAGRKGDRAGPWRWVAAAAVAVPGLTMTITAALLLQTNRGLTTVAAAERQAWLAQRVDLAMTATALGYAGTLLIGVALAVGTWRELRSHHGE